MLNNCIAFEKYDGTNIHFVWQQNYGWVDFGTRRDRFSLTNKGVIEFEKAHTELTGIDNLWDQDSSLKMFLWGNPKYNIYKEIIIITEYYGPNSFAGQHYLSDKKQLTILDVITDEQIIIPQQFSDDFKDFDIAKVIYKGKYSGQFSEDIRNGKYPVNEGVVCKGVVDNKVYMCKIKTNAYMNKLQTQFKDNWKDYWE